MITWNSGNPRHNTTLKVIDHVIRPVNVTLSAITKMELLTGAGNKSEMTLILKKLDKYNILLINDEITLKDFDLVQNYFLSHSLQLPDALIAASAMVTGFELFTYNSKDYRFITGLKLFKVARDL